MFYDPPPPPVHRTVRAVTSIQRSTGLPGCVGGRMMALDPQPCTVQSPGKRSGPPPDYYTVGASVCFILCVGMSFSVTRYGEGWFTMSSGFGVGFGVTAAPGFIDSRARSAHTPSYVNNFIQGNSITLAGGVGPVGWAQQWGNVGKQGAKNWSSEPGVQTVGLGISEQWSYSWDMGHYDGAITARSSPYECAHLGVCN
jgi:hypothetical protein